MKLEKCKNNVINKINVLSTACGPYGVMEQRAGYNKQDTHTLKCNQICYHCLLGFPAIFHTVGCGQDIKHLYK